MASVAMGEDMITKKGITVPEHPASTERGEQRGTGREVGGERVSGQQSE